MAIIECCRIILYLIEWIWTTVILGLFPDRFNITQQLVNGEVVDACLFNLNLGRSRCDYGTAWSAIAFIVLTSTIIWYSLEYCTAIQLPANVEAIIFSWLTVWWFVGAIGFTVTRNGSGPPVTNVPVVFSWMLFVLSAISAFIASRGPKPVEYRGSETADEETPTQYAT